MSRRTGAIRRHRHDDFCIGMHAPSVGSALDIVTLTTAALVAAAAGIVRGITGFGGAMVAAPPLALLLGPHVAVPVVLLLESIVAAPMLLKTRREVDRGVIAPILMAACVTVPLGAFILVVADPQLIRRVIAVAVILFAVMLLRGWRYSGQPRIATSLAVGAVSGAMTGATSIGGPPVILYLLSGPHSAETTRANLTAFIAATSLLGLAMLAYYGLADARVGWTSLWLAPTYYCGLLLGQRLFSRFSDARFRQFTLLLLIAVAIGILLV